MKMILAAIMRKKFRKKIKACAQWSSTMRKCGRNASASDTMRSSIFQFDQKIELAVAKKNDVGADARPSVYRNTRAPSFVGPTQTKAHCFARSNCSGRMMMMGATHVWRLTGGFKRLMPLRVPLITRYWGRWRPPSRLFPRANSAEALDVRSGFSRALI